MMGLTEPAHPLHVAVAELFEDALPSGCVLIRDQDCGGAQRIPLFSSETKSRSTEYCKVDLLVLRNGRIKMIVEIEESGLEPMQVCGKFLTSALTHYYIHELGDDEPIGMDDDVSFVQIMDSSKLKDKTSKIKQWRNIEESINKILPVKGSKIIKYRIFHGDASHFGNKERCKDLITFIRDLEGPPA